MFFLNQPTVIEFTIWSTLPEHFRKPEVNEWGLSNRPHMTTDSFLEGPVFDQQGNLYVTDIPWGRIFKITPQGEWQLLIEYDGEPNGMKFLNQHELLITDYKNGLMLFHLPSLTLKPYLTRRNGESFKGVNDLILDQNGAIYFTDQGQTGLHDPSGRVYRLNPDGKLDTLLSNIPSPNGLALSPKQDILYVAATRGNCIWRVPLHTNNTVNKVSQFFTSYGPSGPDGLACDQAGNLLVCNPGLGFVWLLNPRGEPITIFKTPVGSSTTNIAIGGSTMQTLYCTESTTGTILTAQLPVPGLKHYNF